MKIRYLAAILALCLASASPAQPASSLGDLKKLIVQLRQDAGAAAERNAQHKLDLLIMTIAGDGNRITRPARTPAPADRLTRPATLD
jgi:hypothetical protein